MPGVFIFRMNQTPDQTPDQAAAVQAAELQAILDRCPRPGRKGQRDKTLLAAARCLVDGRSLDQVFTTPGAASRKTYYRWRRAEPLIALTIDLLAAAMRRHDLETRQAADNAARRRRHERRAALLETAANKLETALGKLNLNDSDNPPSITAVTQLLRVYLQEDRIEHGDVDPAVSVLVTAPEKDPEEVKRNLKNKLAAIKAAALQSYNPPGGEEEEGTD